MKTNKTILWRWMLTLIAAVALSASFASCGDDDKDEPPKDKEENVDNNTSKSDLVGKWESEEDNYGYSFGYKLDANGKGYGFEKSPYNDDSDRWSIRWTYNNNRLILTDDYGENDKEVMVITYLDDEIMMYYYADDDDRDEEVLYKVSRFSWE